MPSSNQKEVIDTRILRLIGLEDVFDLDYETYLTLLKEAMVKGRMAKTSIPTEEVELLTNEYKRVKTKKDNGRFEVKGKKITAGSFSVGSIKAKLAGTRPKGLLPAAIGKSPIASSLTESIATIASTISSIADTLKAQKKLTDDATAFDKRKAEQDKRALAESKLEKRFDGLKKAAEKIIAPVKSLLDRVLEFFTTILLGRVVYKLIEWLGNPENANKVKSIIRFLGDWGPAILGGFILFGTKFGKGIRILTRIALSGIGKLAKAIPALLRFGKNNPKTALALASGTYAATQLTQRAFSEGEEPKAQGLAGGGFVIPRFKLPAFSGGGFNFSNMFNGYVSGQKGVDKVPAMLSDGEFVMSRGAVQKYGVDTLESMNAAGGGTNKPKVVSGTTYAAGGGLVGYAGNMIKHHEALSSLKPDQNYYVSLKSPEYKKVNNNTKIYPYLDSVNVPTIGWGATYYDKISNGKKPVKMTDPPITKKVADDLLNKHLGELIPRAKSQLPLWNKMSPQQQGTIVSFLYNAGPNSINPTGPYPKFSKALIGGNMREAAAQVNRSGPPASRINEEKRLLTSGPLDLKKAVAAKPKEEKKSPGIFDRISSGFNSLFTPPAMAKESRYANGGMVNSPINPIDTSKTSVKANIALSKPNQKSIGPVPRPAPKPQVLPTGGISGRRNVRGGGTSSTKTPSFNATTKGMRSKQETLGLMR
jgi:GH24 family phage-related lysozyme (muramidase)